MWITLWNQWIPRSLLTGKVPQTGKNSHFPQNLDFMGFPIFDD
jgi:hypothetical protein